MRKIIFLIALFLGMGVSALAQKTVEYDVFKMNDGRSYKGTVTEETDNYIKISTLENVERVLYRSDIVSKGTESVLVAESVSTPARPYVEPAKFSVGIGGSMYNAYLGGSYRYHVVLALCMVAAINSSTIPLLYRVAIPLYGHP